jgi:hypothetical protein
VRDNLAHREATLLLDQILESIERGSVASSHESCAKPIALEASWSSRIATTG